MFHRRARTRAVTLLLAAMMLLLAACGQSSAPQGEDGEPAETGEEPAGEPKVLIVAHGTDTETLDPHKGTSSPTFTVLSHTFETLFELDLDGKIVPKLAESMDVNEDSTVFTIRLKEGINFSDGTPFNAEAVKANLERILDPEGEFPYAELLEPVKEINVLDEYTVQLVTAEPFGPMAQHLAHEAYAMVSPAVLAQGDDAVLRNPVGTGPFLIEDWRQGEEVVLVKNPNYWGEPAKLDRVIFRVVADESRVVELEAGTIDVATRVPPSEVERLEADPNITIDRTTIMRSIFIYLNAQREPFNDVRVRQAFNYAVNKEAIVENLLAGAGEPMTSPVPPGVFGYSPQTPYEYDPDRARQLLEEAGFDFNQTITLYHPTGRYTQDALVADAVRADLARIGVKVELQTMEWGQYVEMFLTPFEENKILMGMLGWGVATGDADYALYPMFHSRSWPGNDFNVGFYANEEVDRLLDAARTTADPEERARLYADAQKIIWEEAPWLFLHNEAVITAMRSNVTGFISHPTERFMAHEADKQ